MPKERFHWHFAMRVAEKLRTGALADAVLGYPEALLIGAVAHDSGYYLLGDAAAKAAADRLHGTGGHDSFAPFRWLVERAQDLDAEGLAFGLGALTHLAADTVFHPLVFSWTGDPHDPEPSRRDGWLYRHQACETALDQHVEALWGRAPSRTVAQLLRHGGRTLPVIHAVFSGSDSRKWLASHRLLQGLFHRWWARALARTLSRSKRGRDGDWSAAFYDGPSVRHPAFEDEMTWVDPVTGRPSRQTLAQLVVRAEALALDLAEQWEASWSQNVPPFAGRMGPSLDTGIAGNQEQTKRHFSPQWF